MCLSLAARKIAQKLPVAAREPFGFETTLSFCFAAFSRKTVLGLAVQMNRLAPKARRALFPKTLRFHAGSKKLQRRRRKFLAYSPREYIASLTHENTIS
jgi:hypothetical protein